MGSKKLFPSLKNFFYFVCLFAISLNDAFAVDPAAQSQFGLLNQAGPSTSTDFFSPWAIAIALIVIIVVVAVAMWPSEDGANTYVRQRKFARVEQLFLKIAGKVLSDDESQSFLESLKSKNKIDAPALVPPDPLVLIGLSVGGASLMAEFEFKKGQIVILKFDSLPDFPAKEFCVALKIIWARDQFVRGRRSYIAGGKFIYSYAEASADDLRHYLNYLLNEPAT